jgi:radical SAM superfamily enzyme
LRASDSGFGIFRAEILETPGVEDAWIDGVKFITFVIKTLYWNRLPGGEMTLQSRDEYAALVVDFLELLRPQTVVHRLTGETYRWLTVAPAWSVNKIEVMNTIETHLELRDTWQGKLYPCRQRNNFRTAGSALLEAKAF